MEAKELRIGNNVQIFGIIAKVQLEDFKGPMIAIKSANPITLNEDWLLKFGFAANPYEDRYELGSFHVQCDKTKGRLILWVEGAPVLKSVHQLQNLYFAMTGEELTQ